MTIKVQITKWETGTPLPIYRVDVDTATSTWTEHFPTKEYVAAFVRGVKAGAVMMSCMDVRVVDVDGL